MIGEEVIAYYGDAGDGEDLFEVQKLVRCKECKHNPKYTKDFQYGKCVYTCDDDWYACEPMDDFFCAYGERIDNE